MYNGQKQDPRQRMSAIILFFASFCAIAAIVILINWIVDQANLAKNGEPEFTTLSQSDMKDGLFVKGKIEYALGPYANEYTVDENNIRTGEASSDYYYYLVPVYSKTTGGLECFVSFKAQSSDDKEYMEKMAKSTMDGTYMAPLELPHGRMINLVDDQKRILESWLTDKGTDGSESFVDYCAENNVLGTTDKEVILSKMMTYSIYRMDSAGINLLYILIPIIVGGLSVLPMFIEWIKKKSQKKKLDEMKEFGINQPM